MNCLYNLMIAVANWNFEEIRLVMSNHDFQSMWVIANKKLPGIHIIYGNRGIKNSPEKFKFTIDEI